MKKIMIIFLFVISFALFSIGLFYFTNGNNDWKKGLYFQKIYGYIGYVNEDVNLNLYYFNVKDEVEPFEQIFLVTNIGNEISIISKSIQTINKTKNYNERILSLTINVEFGLYEISKLRFLYDQKVLEFDLGNIIIDYRKSEVDSLKCLSFTYLQSFIDGEFELTIKNIKPIEVMISNIIYENDMFIDSNSHNLILNYNEEHVYIVSLTDTSLNQFDIIVFRPIIEFKKTDEDTTYLKTTLMIPINKNNINIDQLIAYINKVDT